MSWDDFAIEKFFPNDDRGGSYQKQCVNNHFDKYFEDFCIQYMILMCHFLFIYSILSIYTCIIVYACIMYIIFVYK